MKKIFLAPFFSVIAMNAAMAATTDWWMRPTVCKLDPTSCYISMGTGYDTEMWDTGGKCWGMKLICPDALTTGDSSDPVPMGKKEINSGQNISKDFDTDILNGDCFGARRVDGATALVNGNRVNVWCNGVLDRVDETTPNGEITYGNQPSCTELAENGYAGIVNNKCYGKYYNPGKYYIECGTALTPTRLIVLNGANYEITSSGNSLNADAVNRIFDTMVETSRTQREKYFTKE